MDGDSAPSGPDEDGPTITPMATLVASKDGGTCKTQNRQVVFVNTGTTIAPIRQKILA
jgi:hypothetical protein